MSGFHCYMFRGRPIADIEKWAHDRGEKMIDYVNTKRQPNIFSGKIDVNKSKGTMPESFFNSLRMTNETGDFKALRKRKPKVPK